MAVKKKNKKCSHRLCGKCGGYIRKKRIGSALSEVCSPKCLAATKDECSCKCGGKYHKGQRIPQVKKTLSALPVGFTGNFLGYRFKVINQFNITGSVTAQIWEIDPPGNIVAELNGRPTDIQRCVSAIVSNAVKVWNTSGKKLTDKDKTGFIKRVTAFVTGLNKEVLAYNTGSSRTTKAGGNKVIKYSTNVKKSGTLEKIVSILKADRKIIKGGYSLKTGKIRKVAGIVGTLYSYFDTNEIKTLDELKQHYFRLAKKYHPDTGGTTVQFQQLQNEYEKLLKKLLQGGNLSEDQQKNEFEIDQALRSVIDVLINIPNLSIKLIGTWLWITGDYQYTYPYRQTFKDCGMIFFKKEGVPYWVYRGSPSASRGKTAMEDIQRKYGVKEFNRPEIKKLTGVRVGRIEKNKLKRALIKLTRALNKR